VKLETLRLDIQDPAVAVVTFHRPEVRNALNAEMVREVGLVLDELAAHGELRAIVFTGAGDQAFISGADISELRERTRADALRRINNGLLRRIETVSVPTIAAIRGFALGGGCELAMACDLRVAGVSARFGQPEVSLGILPGAGATYRLPRLVGVGMAKELIFTGRIIDAEEALGIGLVNRVVDDELVLPTALGLARDIARNSALAVRLSKLAIHAGIEGSTETAMAFESTAQAVLFEDPDKHERMTRFLERRSRKDKPQ
jgi:enoyl-CoA hydratase